MSLTSTAAIGLLPEWDLSDLYTGTNSPLLTRDIQEAEKRAQHFRSSYLGKIEKLSAKDLAEAIKEYENIQDIIGKFASYAQLLYAADMTNIEHSSFYQNTVEKCNDISTHTLFFTLEINRMTEHELQEKLASSPALSHYFPWIRDVRSYRPHQLSDEMEELLHEKYITGAQSWNRLFDETLAGLRFPFDGQQLTCAEILNHLSSPHGEIRRKAAKSMGEILGENAKTFALISNVLAKDKEIEDKWRQFPRAISSRNLANSIEDEVVDSLIGTVRQNYVNLSHRYYQLKARMFGVEKLDYWDRNAPLPGDIDHLIPWEEAVEIVLDSYHAFSPELAEIGRKFFDNNWIDTPSRPGKESGAFAHPTTPSSHPYLLVNYQGKHRDVMTLAHELGHGIHQILAAKQGALMCDTPLTLAETASVFGEQLTFRALLNREKDPAKRKVMIAAKVEDMLNTVVRQIAFCEFERKLHEARRKGEVSLEEICSIWMEIQFESLGSSFRFEEEYKYYWAYISHFIHAPFYVYSYAFGDCLVNSLYAEYSKHPEGFQKKYITMLEAGGTLRHKELLAPFGLDATDPGFWQKGLDVISGFIDELE